MHAPSATCFTHPNRKRARNLAPAPNTLSSAKWRRGSGVRRCLSKFIEPFGSSLHERPVLLQAKTLSAPFDTIAGERAKPDAELQNILHRHEPPIAQRFGSRIQPALQVAANGHPREHQQSAAEQADVQGDVPNIE